MALSHLSGTMPKNHVIENNVFEHTKQWNGQDAPYSMMVAGHVTTILTWEPRRGRVMLAKPITRVKESEPLWRNMLNTYHRFQTDEVAGAKVRASYRDAVVETVSDDEGHFQVRLQPRELGQHTALPQNAYRWRVAMARVREAGWLLANLDVIVICHRPKIGAAGMR